MARNVSIKFLRTTKANLDTQASASNLLVGEPYFITDEEKLGIAKANNAYVLIGNSSPYVVCSTATSLTLNYATVKHYDVELSANASYTLSNIAEGERVTHSIKNTHGSNSIDITLPTAAGHVRSYSFFRIPAGKIYQVEIFRSGVYYFWSWSEMKDATT